jgi:hypothetical protein
VPKCCGKELIERQQFISTLSPLLAQCGLNLSKVSKHSTDANTRHPSQTKKRRRKTAMSDSDIASEREFAIKLTQVKSSISQR